MSYLLKFSRLICAVYFLLINLPTVKANPINSIQTSIPSVSQLSDININSWKFKMLQSLVNRYKCLTPDFLNLEQDTLSRYDFALKLNQCLTFIQQKNTQQIDGETLAIIKRLHQEFSSELIQFDWQLEQLETQVSQLENHSYTPRVELEGEVIFAMSSAWGGDRADGKNKRIDNNFTVGNRVRLNLESSFTGKDVLQIRTQARNIPEFEEATGTQMSNLGFDGDDKNLFEIDELEYEFALSKSTEMVIYAVGGGLGDMVPTVNSLFSGSGDGSISTFGRENPIRRHGGGSSIGISHDFTDYLNLSVGYASNDAEEPDEGFFNTPSSAIAQLTWEPNPIIELALTYVYSHNNVDTGTGSALAGEPFGDETDNVSANSWGAEVSLQLSPNVSFGGWISLIDAKANDLSNSPQADIMTWALLLGVTDLGREGSFLGFVFGQPPKVIHNSLGKNFEEQDTSFHIEAFYLWPITDDIVITPGVFIITSPEHNNRNDTIYIGTIRTTFFF